MRPSTAAWLVGFIAIIALYALGPVFGLNAATPPILGMPPLYSWFVLVPLLNPIILGVVYLIDRRENAGADEDA
ncbi:hypothetical protein FE249_06865 [Acidiphilium multivorum]|uniref:hypothetical protein n=1 Tax=Acidiphilium multivorum TaxID=62140 RepID=UPI001F4C402F|nr:hypothetical protein [Acidiphilium multivorum]UNC13957.1 hypothetical protein FE249_06865 [Acidiphilium multivorum]